MTEAAKNDWHFCQHCCDVIENIADAHEHRCFVGSENIYTDDCGNLFVESVNDKGTVSSKNASDKPGCSTDSPQNQNAVWSRNSTLALLELYEANKDVLDNPKKKTKIWNIICEGLKEAGIVVTPQQVRWKFNRLQEKYKKCLDNNKRSGRAHMTFEYFREMDEIFNVDKNIGDAETFGSKMASSKRKAISDETSSKRKPVPDETSREPISDETSSTSSQKITKRHAADNQENVLSMAPVLSTTGLTVLDKKVRKTDASKLKKKNDLENYFFDHLKRVEESQRMRDEKIDKYVKTKAESLQLRKKELETRENEIEQKRVAEIKKQKSKQERHEELMEIERQKMSLLRKLLKEKNSDTE